MAGEFRDKIMNNSLWSIFSNVGTNILSFVVMIFLARLLSPEDFGIVAISAVFVGIVAIFQDLGMGSAIIQRQNIDGDYLSTSFVVSLVVGAALALLLCAISPLAASFYGKDILKPVLMVSSVGFITGPLVSVQMSVMAKRLEFRKIAVINLSTQALMGAISIILAVLGYGVWSLVLGRVMSQPLMVPMVWRLSPLRPGLSFVRKCFDDLLGFSSHLLGFNFINYFARNLDNLIVGKYLGPQALGFYSLDYNIMLKPLQLVTWSLGKVLFPVFSGISGDMERTRALYLKTVRSISLITFPMMACLAIVAREFIVTAFGKEWEPAVGPLQLLCIVGALQSIGMYGMVFISQGRTDVTLKYGIFSSALTLTAFIIGIRWGINGLILGYIAVTVPIIIIGQFIANGMISMRMYSYLKALVPASVCCIMMVAVIYTVKLVDIRSLHMDIRTALVVLVAAGAASYLTFALKVVKVSEAGEAFEFFKRKLKPRQT